MWGCRSACPLLAPLGVTGFPNSVLPPLLGFMSLTGPRTACDVLCFASGFHIPTKLLEMPRLFPQFFEDPLPRGGGWWQVVTVMFLEHVPGSRFPARRISHSVGFGDLKNANSHLVEIIWKSCWPIREHLGNLDNFVRHIIKTQKGWQQIKGGRILWPWHSPYFSSLYSHNTNNILIDSKPDF